MRRSSPALTSMESKLPDKSKCPDTSPSSGTSVTGIDRPISAVARSSVKKDRGTSERSSSTPSKTPAAPNELLNDPFAMTCPESKTNSTLPQLNSIPSLPEER